jgi:hypothetical protein
MKGVSVDGVPDTKLKQLFRRIGIFFNPPKIDSLSGKAEISNLTSTADIQAGSTQTGTNGISGAQLANSITGIGAIANTVFGFLGQSEQTKQSKYQLEALTKQSGVAKNTIKRYLEYLEAAFLITRVERIDQTAKRFKRAISFKVYLVNPSMRAALFGQINPDSDAMGALTETAIFSQWQHSQQTQLYYARWKTGEIDIVNLDSISQQPSWAVEVKWSDRPYKARQELDNCIEFINQNPDINQPILITSKTISDAIVHHKGVRFEFFPSSLYAYTLGVNLLQKYNRSGRPDKA